MKNMEIVKTKNNTIKHKTKYMKVEFYEDLLIEAYGKITYIAKTPNNDWWIYNSYNHELTDDLFDSYTIRTRSNSIKILKYFDANFEEIK